MRVLSHNIVRYAIAVTWCVMPLAAQAQGDHASHHPAETATPPPPVLMAIPMPMPATTPTGKPDIMMGSEGGMKSEGMKNGSMMKAENVEIHLTAVHDGLNITPRQAQLWAGFAKTMRHNAKAMEMHHMDMMSAHHQASMPTFIQQLSMHEKGMMLGLQLIRTTRIAVQRLYIGLSPKQRMKADALLSEHMSMMPQMAKMQGMMK